jgi:RyR domain
MTVTDVAQVCHDANRAYCKTLEDYSQLPWEEAPIWQRNSAESGVKFKIDNPESTPENSHENWLKDKEKDGWTFGETKDPAKKTHPCFVAYGDLPAEQRVKDAIFQGIVTAFLAEGMIG